MPDFKFEYIVNNSPWPIHELGLAEPGEEDSFYIMPTGNSPTEMKITPRSIEFRSPVHIDHLEDPEKYLDLLLLREFDSPGENDETYVVTDAHMANVSNRRSIWTESDGEPVEVTINDEQRVLPDNFWVYELIPVETEIQTMTQLKEKLREISGNDIWMTVQH